MSLIVHLTTLSGNEKDKIEVTINYFSIKESFFNSFPIMMDHNLRE